MPNAAYLVSVCCTKFHNFKPIWKMLNDGHIVVVNIESWNVVVQISHLNNYLVIRKRQNI